MQYDELGTPGLQSYSGFISAAYNTQLNWPTVQPLYSRLRRSDPEISVIRQVFSALARAVKIDWEMPDDPSDGDKQAQEFAQQATDDIAGGPGAFIETMTSQVPFMGWGWWEVVPGLRRPDWTPPGEDDWRSEYSDGKIGIRRLAWRDSSSFQNWDITDRGRLRGMVQQDFPHPAVNLPLDRSLHLTFGDNNNPEGLSPLEAVWRLERIKYGLEVINGIGFEHAAGYLEFTSTKGLTPADDAMVRRAARNIMTAQEGNYAALPEGVTAELKDVPFSAAASLLEAIRYYGILKLMIYNMQWMALSSVSGAGSFASMSDSSSMFMITFNSMMEGFANQIDAQIGKRLFQWNQFPGMTKRPKLVVTPIEKTINLSELATILGPIKNTLPLGDEDFVAIRRRTGFLPETLPEVEEQPEPEPQQEPEAEDTPQDEPEPEQIEAMAKRVQYWKGYLLKHPEAVNEQSA
jgi:hypothetical protein